MKTGAQGDPEGLRPDRDQACRRKPKGQRMGLTLQRRTDGHNEGRLV